MSETEALMRERYVNLIGIVGLPNAGKTACLASLYLLLSQDKLAGFRYANSRTLMALDEIARGARRWNQGNPPEQMTVHTELADDRQAGFLHLRLRRIKDGRSFDLVMPDLPGEWSRALITNGDWDRLRFLAAAEVIWVMVNGRDFEKDETRQLASHQVTNLLERMAAMLPPRRPRIMLVASWRDTAEIPDAALHRIRAFAEPLGLAIEFSSIASFSDHANVAPGTGLPELIASTLEGPSERPDPWPDNHGRGSLRAFLNFGRLL